MIDPILASSLVLSILIVGSFFLLLIMQVNSYANKKMENPFFIIAVVSGSIGITAYIFAVIISFNNSSNVELINNLHSYLFFFFTICFYFWYKHYQKIITLNEKSTLKQLDFLKELNFIPNWMYPVTLIDILFVLGLGIDIGYYILYLLHLNLIVFGIIWNLLKISNTDGRMVTVFSVIAFLSGLIFFYISYIIINNNLIELNKVPIFELLSILSLGFSNVFLFINDIFITFSVYPLEINNLVVGIGLLIIFFSLIMLLANYILLNPSHVSSPSLYRDITNLMNTINDPNFSLKTSIQSIPTSNNPLQANSLMGKLKIPQKLNGTCIIILIYLMKNNELSSILAKDLEVNLNLNKSTISYNLKILENNDFINRFNPIEGISKGFDEEIDQRRKLIKINDNGKNFLILLHQYLNTIF